jgi:hypothetical protein
MRSVSQPCICLHTSFLSLESPVAMSDRITSGTRGQGARQTNVSPRSSLSRAGPRLSQINGRIQDFRRGQAIMRINPQSLEKISIPREWFWREWRHSPGLRKGLISQDLPERTGDVDWHGYCTEHVIRGDRSELSSGFSGWDLPGSPVTTSSGK